MDSQRFVIPVTTALFFPPTFAALAIGYRKVRHEVPAMNDGMAET